MLSESFKFTKNLYLFHSIVTFFFYEKKIISIYVLLSPLRKVYLSAKGGEGTGRGWTLLPGGCSFCHSNFVFAHRGQRNRPVVVLLFFVRKVRIACWSKRSWFRGDPELSWTSKNFLLSLHEELFKGVLFPFTRWMLQSTGEERFLLPVYLSEVRSS